MKRLRHYDKDLAVVIAVFGSSDKEAFVQYCNLEKYIKQRVPENTEVRISISSRTIMKKLENRGEHYLTLPEQLANLDRQGYKKVVVTSINVFPTAEHEQIELIVDAFSKISETRYRVTMPLFAKAKPTNRFLETLNEKIRSSYDISNVIFMAHGASKLHSPGNQTFTYVRDYLKLLNPRNFLYTLEGSFGYQKDFILNEITNEKSSSAKNNKVIIVPLLLVAGTHYKNDVLETRDNLNEIFDTALVPENFLGEGGFCLLKMEETKKYFTDELLDAIKKLNW